MRTIEHVDGVDVRISRAEGKPLLLLVRMASGGVGIWDAVWDDLARHYTVANFDLVDAARLAEDAPPRTRFTRLADRIAEMATVLRFSTFHVFGWFGGAHVALACMLRAPTRVRSAILLDPFFALPDRRKIERAIAFKQRLYEADDRTLYAYYWVMAGFTPGFMERNFDVVERLARARIEADRFVKLDPARWLRWVHALRSNWLTEAELAAMRMPTLVLATGLDSWHAGPTVGTAQALAERLPCAELSVIENYGTFFFIERPELFTERAGAFLRRMSAAERAAE